MFSMLNIFNQIKILATYRYHFFIIIYIKNIKIFFVKKNRIKLNGIRLLKIPRRIRFVKSKIRRNTNYKMSFEIGNVKWVISKHY